jgi:PBP1b-binding outer membrane lipoprotein LpoB
VTPRPCRSIWFATVTAFVLASAGCRTEYIDSRGESLAVSPDRLDMQDWTALAERIAQEMTSSGVLDRYGRAGRPASMLINPVQNQTGESIDPEAITKLVRIQLLATGRVQIITGGGAGTQAEDPIVAESRQRRRLAAGLEDPLDGVPDLSARLRLFRDRVRVDGKTQSAYFLQMTLSDTATQRSIWEGQATVAKRGSKATIGTR